MRKSSFEVVLIRNFHTFRMDTDDSFLNDMDDLLDDGDGIGTTMVDDIGEDDLLNEMEELLA